jgi:hypothetical protein
MKSVIRLEEAALAGLAIYLFSTLEIGWGWFALLFFAPDLSFIAYTLGPSLGGITYDVVHHRGALIAMYIVGALTGTPALEGVALIFLAHSSMDRVFGYGLKYLDSFDHTHLGRIGKSAGPQTNSGM